MANTLATMDWPVAASNMFLVVAVTTLVASPMIGLAGGWRRVPLRFLAALGAVLIGSLVLLAVSWRAIAGGIAAAVSGHLALIIALVAIAELGRLARAIFEDRLAAGLAALTASVIVVAGIFALAPLTENVSPAGSHWLLVANPLVTVTSAAGIDLLHLDTIYRTSPLAHRGVVLPAWTTACAVYAVVGLAASGASRIRPWSHRS
jgi:hypothetical protein